MRYRCYEVRAAHLQSRAYHRDVSCFVITMLARVATSVPPVRAMPPVTALLMI